MRAPTSSLLLVLFSGCASTAVAPPRPPNVVLIYTDDQGYGDCGALNPECGFPTPNIDRLARGGMTFTDGHSASGVCTPSRYALLTGRYSWRTKLKRGVMGADADCLIEDGRWTIASLLRGRGYRTAMFGKWHLGMQIPGTKGQRDWSEPVLDGPIQKGFDEFYGIPASMNYGVLTWIEDDRILAPADRWTRKKFPQSEIKTRPLDYRMAPPYESESRGDGDIEVASSFVDDAVLRITTEKTVEFLRSRDGAPFFAYVALTSPHLPHCTAEEFRGKSGMGNYGDFMLETDHRIGQILDALEETGADRNTIVVLTSDNGPENNYKDWIRLYGHHANGGLRGGKRDLYEGGHRVPFFVRWPGVVDPGSQSDALVGQVDLLATLAEIAGVSLPEAQAEDSLSFAPLLAGGAGGRGSLVHHSGDGRFGFRRGPWKLVFPPTRRSERPELFHLGDDSREENDVAESFPDIVHSLTEELTEVVRRGRSGPGASLDNDGDDWWPQLSWLNKPR